MTTSPFRIPRKTRSGVPESLIEWLLGLRALEKRYLSADGGQYPGKDFLKLVLNTFKINHRISGGSLKSIPKSGPAVIVANHPFGGIEGVALADLLLSVRNDVKVLTNEMLCRIPDLRDIFIGVDVLSKQRRTKNKKAIEEAEKWVGSGHLLLIFPAGEVSSYHWKYKKIIDPIWRQTAARIAKNTEAAVTPVFIEGANSWLFQALGLIHPQLRTLRLIRELINKKGETIYFRIGPLLTKSELSPLESDKVVTSYLRLHTYSLSPHSSSLRHNNIKSTETPLEEVISAIKTDQLELDIAQLSKKNCLLKKGEMEVYCAEAKQLPHVLQEIGRLREITFRQVGEGTGHAYDIDSYDQYYLHLFLWDSQKSKIIGAYRIGEVDKILREKGIHGIYSRSLFRYHAVFLKRLGSCLEMGRSFVCPEYQKSLSALMLLWKGIGAFVAANPKYRVLFGPVSISSDYSDISRQLMAGCLQINNSDKTLAELVQPLTPLKRTEACFWNQSDLEGLTDIDKLSSLIQQIEQDRKGVPVLLRQYLKLRGELVAFNVDPDFNNALDGLIIVDLTRVDRRLLSKYMGANKASDFINYNRNIA